jgi:hypothetical protein
MTCCLLRNRRPYPPPTRGSARAEASDRRRGACRTAQLRPALHRWRCLGQPDRGDRLDHGSTVGGGRDQHGSHAAEGRQARLVPGGQAFHEGGGGLLGGGDPAGMHVGGFPPTATRQWSTSPPHCCAVSVARRSGRPIRPWKRPAAVWEPHGGTSPAGGAAPAPSVPGWQTQHVAAFAPLRNNVSGRQRGHSQQQREPAG